MFFVLFFVPSDLFIFCYSCSCHTLLLFFSNYQLIFCFVLFFFKAILLPSFSLFCSLLPYKLETFFDSSSKPHSHNQLIGPYHSRSLNDEKKKKNNYTLRIRNIWKKDNNKKNTHTLYIFSLVRWKMVIWGRGRQYAGNVDNAKKKQGCYGNMLSQASFVPLPLLCLHNQ